MEISKPSDGVDPNFDSRNFSDAVLTIVVDGNVEENLHDDGFRKAKRRREEKINIDDQPGEEDVEPWCNLQDVLRSKSIFVSSTLLAAKSLFFCKLFTCTSEAPQHQVIVHIDASEEAAFMDLLKYMYSGKLTSTEAPSITNVLIVADKFGVISCLSYCSKLLLDLPMTLESALLYLDLPPIVSASSCCQLLTERAKAYLVAQYSDMEKLQNEADDLSLVAIEVILYSNELRAPSEDVVYDFVLNWVRTHYSKLEDRCNIFKSHLSHVIRFPSMTCKKLMKALACEELDHDDTRKFIMEALFYKNGSPIEESDMNLDMAMKRRFTQRSYKHHPVKVVSFEAPYQQCIVYLDLTRDELECLLPLGHVCSQAFRLGGQEFFLSAKCSVDPRSESHCFGLFLHMPEGRSPTVLSIHYEFAAREKPTCAFKTEFREYYKFTGGKTAGCTNLFNIPWSSFMSNGSLFFIGDKLHLRAELTIRKPRLQLIQREPQLQFVQGQPLPQLHGPNHHHLHPQPRMQRNRGQRQH